MPAIASSTPSRSPNAPGATSGAPTAFSQLLGGLYRFTPDTIYLSPAPLYHASPAGWTTMTQRLGGTAVVMERFDAEEWLALVERRALFPLAVQGGLADLAPLDVRGLAVGRHLDVLGLRPHAVGQVDQFPQPCQFVFRQLAFLDVEQCRDCMLD